MIFVLAPSNLANPSALEARSLPKQIFHRSTNILPKRLILDRVFWRLAFQHPMARYGIALTPFPLALFIWPHLALPISQAPLLMFIAIWLFEARVLSVPRDRRRALIDADAAGRVLDTLRVRSTAALIQFAAARGIDNGELYLVVEQSEMIRVPPLTFVSVQHDQPSPHLIDLTDEEQDQITKTLFDHDLTEALLLRTNIAESTFLRSTVLDPKNISAHARMLALAGA